MDRMRTLQEAEQVINTIGRAPEPQPAVVLPGGRELRTPDEIRYWLQTAPTQDDATS